MCGLAGFARHPTAAPGAKELFPVFEALMGSIEHRGKDATGIATANGSNDFLWKWAEPVAKVLRSEPWGKVKDTIADDTQVVIGHVRWATQNNAKRDDCAHPFRFGRVVGAHNGIITNWREIEKKLRTRTDPEFKVDSEAVFYGLNLCKKPESFLEEVEGDFALTWMKGRTLYLTRNEDRPLHCAYVPLFQTLFWNSESSILSKVLKEFGVGYKDYEMWQVQPSAIYQYRPSQFTDAGTNAEKVQAKFKQKKRWSGTGTGRRGGSQRNFQYGDTYWDSTWGVERQRALPSGSTSNTTLGPTEQSSVQLTLSGIQSSFRAEIDSLWKKTRWLQETLEMMYADAEDSGVRFSDQVRHRLDVFYSVTPYRDDKQGVLPINEGPAQERPKLTGTGTCYICNEVRGDKGRLLDAPNGAVVHEKCVFEEVGAERTTAD